MIQKFIFSVFLVLITPIIQASDVKPCTKELVLELLTESIVEVIDGISESAVVLENIKQVSQYGFGTAHCGATFVYKPLFETGSGVGTDAGTETGTEVELMFEYLVQEDYDNFYVTLLKLDF